MHSNDSQPHTLTPSVCQFRKLITSNVLYPGAFDVRIHTTRLTKANRKLAGPCRCWTRLLPKCVQRVHESRSRNQACYLADRESPHEKKDTYSLSQQTGDIDPELM